MSVADLLLLLSQQFETDSINLQHSACLNARFRGTDCTYCADICPAESAISVTNGRPTLNHDACLHCGLCLHRCPTGAFTRPDNFSRKLIRTVQSVPAGPVELVCPQSSEAPAGPTPFAVQTQRCLAAISATTLLELAAGDKDIWLDDSQCVGCPLGAVQSFLAEIAAEANGWAILVTGAGRIHLRSQRSAEPAVNRRLLDATQPPVSRRGLFGVLKQNATKSGNLPEEPAIMIKTGRDVPPAERLPHNLPPERARVLKILTEQAGSAEPILTASQANLPIADVRIDVSRCSACTLCAKFCPTGAVKYLSDGQSFALTFSPDLCLGQVCNICQLACPEQAITTEPVADSPHPLAKKPLAAGELAPCVRCKTPIARGPGMPETCYACRPHGSVPNRFAPFS